LLITYFYLVFFSKEIENQERALETNNAYGNTSTTSMLKIKSRQKFKLELLQLQQSNPAQIQQTEQPLQSQLHSLDSFDHSFKIQVLFLNTLLVGTHRQSVKEFPCIKSGQFSESLGW
jgi:hypothetical protein